MFTLKRIAKLASGIFSVLLFDGRPIGVTLTHAFPDGHGGFQPIVPPGSYVLKRGIHRLSNVMDFVTYEIMDVEGHSGLVFHVGNKNSDSEGCELTGEAFGFDGKGNTLVLSSADAFREFMELAGNAPELELEVEDCV